MNLFDLTGKTAIVTGGSTGLGAGMSLALAEAGADIILVDHNERTQIASDINKLGRKTLSLTGDLTDLDFIRKVVDDVIDSFDKIDILVNNAGIIRRTPAIDYSEKDWDDVMNLNSKSLFFLSQTVAQGMMKRGYGKIINIASLLTFTGGLTVPSYAASKGAVGQITKALANEWASKGICINAIVPGYMETNNTKPLREDPKRFKEISDRIPTGRWGKPDDLKGAVIFLASNASDYVNGHLLAVDGGWLVR
jgi:2-deoxy-D-gluconate 3-dehydrogenase